MMIEVATRNTNTTSPLQLDHANLGNQMFAVRRRRLGGEMRNATTEAHTLKSFALRRTLWEPGADATMLSSIVGHGAQQGLTIAVPIFCRIESAMGLLWPFAAGPASLRSQI